MAGVAPPTSGVWRVVRAVIVVAYAVIVLFVSFWAGLGGDEGGYVYQARLLAEGRLPFVDFFASHGPNFYLAYAVPLRLFGHSFEAARLVSVICLTLTFAALVQIAYVCSRRIWVALAVGTLFAANVQYLFYNVQMKHYGPSNAALVAAAALLIFRRPVSRTRALWCLALVGALYAFAANARIPLAAAGPVLLAFALWELRREGWGRSDLARGFAAFAIGVLAGSSFTLYLFFRDPAATWFGMLGHTFYTRPEMYTGTNLSWVTDHRWEAFLIAWREWFLAGPVLMSLAAAGVAVTVRGLLSRDGAKQGREAAHARRAATIAIFVIAVLTAVYGLRGLVAEYLNQVIPFAVIATIPVFLWIGAHRSIAVLVLAVLGVVFVRDARAPLAFYRQALFDRRPMPAWRTIEGVYIVAERLRTLTPPGATVLSWYTAPVFAADRYMPPGMEQGFGVPELFWRIASDDTSRRYHLVTKSQMVTLIKERRLAAIVHDVYADLTTKWSFPEYPELLTTYVPAGRYDGYWMYVPDGKPIPFGPEQLALPRRSFADDVKVSLARLWRGQRGEANVPTVVNAASTSQPRLP